MRQGIDITEIEDRTKIRAKYLRALENEEFDMLPGSTFAKSFLRTYAEALGIDPHVLVEEYRALHESPEERHEVQFGGPPPRPREPRRGPRAPARGFLAALVVLGVVAFLLVLGLTGGEETDGGRGDGDRARAAGTAEREAAAERERRERAAERRRREAAARERVQLRIAPPEDGGGTYACVDDGAGEVLFEGTVADDPQAFRGRRLRLNLGRRQSAVSLNGERVAIELTSEPIALEFRPDREPREIEGPAPCA